MPEQTIRDHSHIIYDDEVEVRLPDGGTVLLASYSRERFDSEDLPEEWYL